MIELIDVVIESLIKAGAFDRFGYHRAQLMSGYSQFLDRATQHQKDKETGQVSLFDMGTKEETVVKLPDVKSWSRVQSLSFEKEVLGFYLSDHPLRGFENFAKIWTSATVIDLPTLISLEEQQKIAELGKPKWGKQRNKKRVVVAGLITEYKELITKKGTRMAFAKVEDLTGTAELIVFPDVYSKYQELLKEEKPLLIGGTLEVENGNAKIMADTFALFDDVLKKTKKISVRLDKIEAEDYIKLDSLLCKYFDVLPVHIKHQPDVSRALVFAEKTI